MTVDSSGFLRLAAYDLILEFSPGVSKEEKKEWVEL